MKSRRRAIVEHQGEEDEDLLVTLQDSLEERQDNYGTTTTNPTVGTGGAQTGDAVG